MADIELTLGQKRDRAARAKELLEHPLLIEAVDKIRVECVSEWRKTQPHDAAGREFAWHQMKALDAVMTELRRVVFDGEIAARRIREQDG